MPPLAYDANLVRQPANSMLRTTEYPHDGPLHRPNHLAFETSRLNALRMNYSHEKARHRRTLLQSTSAPDLPH
jgi:hypothetical protein